MPTSRPTRRRRLFCRRAALLSLGCATGRAQFQPAAFVHIPKTGGTSIHRALFDADCPALPITDAFTNHQLTAAAATRDGGRCFLVLREPTDRFVSSYSYFVSFNAALRARLTNRTRARDARPTPTPRARDARFPTVGSLIDAAVARKKNSRFLDSNVFFTPQSQWVDVDDFARTTVVCYDAERLSERVAAAIRRVTVPPCNATIPRVNVADRPEAEGELNDTHRAWLRKRYGRDYALWQEHCATAKLDRKLE